MRSLNSSAGLASTTLYKPLKQRPCIAARKAGGASRTAAAREAAERHPSTIDEGLDVVLFFVGHGME